MGLEPDFAVIDAVFTDASAPYAVQATLSELQHSATELPSASTLATDLVFGLEVEMRHTTYWTYTAQLQGPGGTPLSERRIDDRNGRHRDVGALLARLLAHAFARGLPVVLTRREAVVEMWDPRWPLAMPESALQSAVAHDVLRRNGWQVDGSPGAAILSTGWEPRARDGLMGAVGMAGNLLLGALGGDPIANLREAKTTFFAEPRGVRVVEERSGVVARDFVIERSRIWTLAVVHGVGAGSPEPAKLLVLDATTGPRVLPFVHRRGPSAMTETVVALRTALACALLGR